MGNDADLARDPYAVLAKVEEGAEVNRGAEPSSRGNDQTNEAFRAAHLRMHSLRKGQRLEGDFRRRIWQGCRGRDWRPQPNMESSLLGLILDSSVIIAAERTRQTAEDLLMCVGQAFGELVHGVARAKTTEIRVARRAFIDELKKHVPVHPITDSTAEIAGQISGEKAAKGITLPADDLPIGASAIEQGYAVATLNTRHFQKNPRAGGYARSKSTSGAHTISGTGATLPWWFTLNIVCKSRLLGEHLDGSSLAASVSDLPVRKFFGFVIP